LDKFPEAFKRFEQVVDVSKIKTFQQLLSAFRLWAGRKWVGSPLQVEALKEEAFKREIPQIPVTREEYEREKAEIDRLYRRVYYCRRRFQYNEAVFKRLTLERFHARGKRRLELEKRIKEAQERMEFWRSEWQSAYLRLKREHARFRLKVVVEGGLRE
jgi:hypothetical protein